MTVSVIVPVYNEEKTIATTIRAINAVNISKQVIIVDDGSTDATREAIGMLCDQYQFILIRHEGNQGKGTAIQSALAHATGEISVIQDADLETSPDNYPRLVEPIIRGETGVVFTYRIRAPITKESLSHWVYRWGNAVQTCLANLLFGASIRDVNSGCKAFRTDILKAFELRERGFAVEHEMTAKALKRSRCIYQLPIRYFPRTIRQGKKINFFDGIKGITALIRYRFIP